MRLAATAIADIATCISRRARLVNECILPPRRWACEQPASERFLMSGVNRYLNLSPEQGQVVYHFAIGYPVSDPRLEG